MINSDESLSIRVTSTGLHIFTNFWLSPGPVFNIVAYNYLYLDNIDVTFFSLLQSIQVYESYSLRNGCKKMKNFRASCKNQLHFQYKNVRN